MRICTGVALAACSREIPWRHACNRCPAFNKYSPIDTGDRSSPRY
jgi:hypothetical protein